MSTYRRAHEASRALTFILADVPSIDPMSVNIRLEYGDRHYTAEIHVADAVEVEAFREALGEPPEAVVEESWNNDDDLYQLSVTSADGAIRVFALLSKAW